MSPGLITNLGLIMETITSAKHYPVQYGHTTFLKHLYKLPHNYLAGFLRLAFHFWKLQLLRPRLRISFTEEKIYSMTLHCYMKTTI